MKCLQGNTINGEKLEISKFVKIYYTKQNVSCFYRFSLIRSFIEYKSGL